MLRFRACGQLLILINLTSRELKRDGTMKDEESLNPDDTFCQAQVDVQKMIEQLKKQADSDQENE